MAFSLRRSVLLLALALSSLAACSGPKPAPAAACDATCQDRTAVRAIREMLKLAYNLTVQGKPTGAIDVTVPCLKGGTVRVHGDGSSNALQGTTDVRLTYELASCGYVQKDTQPAANYAVTLNGTITESGTLSAVAGSTTAVMLESASLDLVGTVYDPPLDYEAKACPMKLSQNGGNVSGTLCGREVGTSF